MTASGDGVAAETLRAVLDAKQGKPVAFAVSVAGFDGVGAQVGH